MDMIPKTTLEQWRVLQAVVDHGGYAQAAMALHKSQSALSYTVARLQEQLGIELLVLEGRKAQLTPAGSTLLRRSRDLLSEACRLEQLATQLRQGWEAEVRLGVESLLPTSLLAAMLVEFAPQAPNTRIKVREEVLSGAEELLLRGEVDLAVVGVLPPGFLGEPVLAVEFIAVAAPGHALHRLERPLCSDDLARQLQVVVRDSGSRNRDAGWLGAAQRWTVSSPATSAELVSSGQGFAWLPLHLIADRLADGRLLPLPLITGQRRKVNLHLVVAQPELAGPATRVLAGIVRRLATEYQAPQFN